MTKLSPPSSPKRRLTLLSHRVNTHSKPISEALLLFGQAVSPVTLPQRW